MSYEAHLETELVKERSRADRYRTEVQQLQIENAEALSEISRHHVLILEMRDLLEEAQVILVNTEWKRDYDLSEKIRLLLNRSVGDPA